jgi:hypothetical protein
MKCKSLIVVLLMATAALAYNNATVAGNIGNIQPNNVALVTYGDLDITDAIDSIGADSFVVAGPYALAASSSSPMYAGFQVRYPPDLFTSGDSLVLSYQLTYGKAISDTTATWTAVDTVQDAGETGAYTSLASKAGVGIIFKLKAIGDEAAIIKKPIRILFAKAGTYMIKQ